MEAAQRGRAVVLACCLAIVGVLTLFSSRESHAEYGDVVLNNYAEAAGMRPAVFPHWFHRIRFRCKVCHADLGFKMKAGGNEINMAKIIDGQYCGACHNGEVAWSIENCDLCHSGKPGTVTQIQGATAAGALVAKQPTKTTAPETSAVSVPAATKKK